MSALRTFTTPRLLLRPTDATDAAFLHELMNTEAWLRYIGDRGIGSPAAATTYIAEKIGPQFERLGYGNYTLVRRSDGTPVGTCGLYDREGLPEVDLGFALLPDYYRQGYAAEAARELLRAAFAEFGLTVVSAITTPDNIASQRLLERLGFSRAGAVHLPGDAAELLYYRMSGRDPHGVRR